MAADSDLSDYVECQSEYQIPLHGSLFRIIVQSVYARTICGLLPWEGQLLKERCDLREVRYSSEADIDAVVGWMSRIIETYVERYLSPRTHYHGSQSGIV